MEKNTTNASGSQKDSFKNTPHVDVGSANASSSKSAAGVKSSSSDLSASNPSEVINTVKNRIVDQAGPAFESLKENFQGISTTARPYVDSTTELVRRYPIYSILGAAAIGTFVGMWMRRPSSRV